EVHRDLDGLVELGGGAVLQEADGLGQLVLLVGVDTLARLGNALCDLLSHRISPPLPGPWNVRSLPPCAWRLPRRSRSGPSSSPRRSRAPCRGRSNRPKTCPAPWSPTSGWRPSSGSRSPAASSSRR